MPETAESEPGGSSPPKLTTLSTQHSLAAATNPEGMSPALRQVTLDIEGDEGLQSLVRIYQGADAAKRQLLLGACQYIVKYENFQIFGYPRTHQRSPAFFRLMDLPTELRLRISEFALSQRTPLQWHWPTYNEHKMIGSFRNLDEITSLARACRQLYSEVSSLVWKVNVLAFETYIFGGDYQNMIFGSGMDVADDFCDACDACRFFLRSIPSTSLKEVRCLTFPVQVPLEERERLRIFQSAADLFLMTPSADVRIEAGNWYDWGEQKTSRLSTSTLESSLKFVRRAREIEATLSTINLHGAERNWRIYPSYMTVTKYLEEQLDGTELETALRWCKDGI